MSKLKPQLARGGTDRRGEEPTGAAKKRDPGGEFISPLALGYNDLTLFSARGALGRSHFFPSP
jgi:hypothetical protein